MPVVAGSTGKLAKYIHFAKIEEELCVKILKFNKIFKNWVPVQCY